MNENINLCEILKGHEGETFYSPIFGDIVYLQESDEILTFDSCDDNDNISDKSYHTPILLYSNGKYYKQSDEIAVYPSKDQRDWNKWIEEQKSKVPKTWSEYCKIIPPSTSNDYKDYPFAVQNSVFKRKDITPIEKSALALLKIHQLIEVGYGGNITKEEWKDSGVAKWRIGIHYNDELMKDYCVAPIAYTPIAFHTKKQADEFLKYPENVQLLKDYFMI